MVWEIQLGFWDGLLVTSAVIFGIWGALYAGTLALSLIWVAVVGILALALYVIGKRFVRMLIKGKFRKKSSSREGKMPGGNE